MDGELKTPVDREIYLSDVPNAFTNSADVDRIIGSLNEYIRLRLTDFEARRKNTGKEINIRQTRYEAATKIGTIVNGDAINGKHQVYDRAEDTLSDDGALDLRNVTFGAPSRRARGKESRDGIASRATSGRSIAKRALACPFLKHDPERYQRDRHCACASWETASRVKEHVFRRHVPSGHRCYRCREVFKSASCLHDHQRVNKPCEMRAEDPNDISEAQLQELRSKKKPPGQGVPSEEAKWKRMYEILFPNDDVAVVSPYWDLRKLQRENLINVFDEYMRTELAGMSLSGHFDQDAQDNIRTHARNALQRAIGELETNPYTPTALASIHPEAQRIHESGQQNLGIIPNPGIPQVYGESDDTINIDLQYGTAPFSDFIDITALGAIYNFEDWSIFPEHTGRPE